MANIYNWKNEKPPFSDNPKGLINLLDSVIFTHHPTWDDCQQLLHILFTEKEKEPVLTKAQNLVPLMGTLPLTRHSLTKDSPWHDPIGTSTHPEVGSSQNLLLGSNRGSQGSHQEPN